MVAQRKTNKQTEVKTSTCAGSPNADDFLDLSPNDPDHLQSWLGSNLWSSPTSVNNLIQVFELVLTNKLIEAKTSPLLSMQNYFFLNNSLKFGDTAHVDVFSSVCLYVFLLVTIHNLDLCVCVCV